MLSKGVAAAQSGVAKVVSTGSKAFFSSLSPAERRWHPYKLPQWSLHPRAARERPDALATWDKLVEPPKAAASVTVPDVIQAATEAHPHSDAFAAVGVEEEYTWDFPTLRYITRGFGAGLVDLGHKHGSKYMTWGECGPEMAALALAGSHVGAINVGMPAEASVEDVARAVQSLGVRSLYFQERLGQLDAFSGLVDQFAPRAHNSGEINWLDSKRFRSLKHLINATGEAYTHGTMTLNAAAPYDMDPNPADSVRPWLHADDTVLIPFASISGKITQQDAVSGANALATAAAVAQELGLQPADRVLFLASPNTKVGLGALLACVQQHAKIATVGRTFKVADAADAFEKQRPTHVVCTAEQLALLEGAGISKHSLRGGLVLNGQGKPSLAGVSLAPVDCAATAAGSVALKLA